MRSHYAINNYKKIIDLATSVNKHPDYLRSQAHLSYAKSLEHLERTQEAEIEYKQFNTRYGDFEGKYMYSCFLENQQRKEEAIQLLTSAIDESKHMGYKEKRNYNYWIRQCVLKRKELEKGSNTK